MWVCADDYNSLVLFLPPVGHEIDTPATNCSQCSPGQYQDHVNDINGMSIRAYGPKCKFCKVGRYEAEIGSTACSFCQDIGILEDLEYVSKCDGARECMECEVGLVSDARIDPDDAPYGFASCTTGYAESPVPNVTLARYETQNSFISHFSY